MSEHTAENDARPVCDCAPDCAERIACEKVGEVGHFACGWCEKHGQANHICMCLAVQSGHVFPPAGTGRFVCRCGKCVVWPGMDPCPIPPEGGER